MAEDCSKRRGQIYVRPTLVGYVSNKKAARMPEANLFTFPTFRSNLLTFNNIFYTLPNARSILYRIPRPSL